MKTGKLSQAILSRSVIKEIHEKNPAVIKGASLGNDACVIKTSGNMVMATTTAVEFDGMWSRLAINRAINDVACTGGRVCAISLNITLPVRFSEIHLKEIMRQAEGVCRQFRIQIAGGHTMVSEYVLKPVVSVTAIGELYRKLEPDFAVGDDIILTKWIGMEGAYIMSLLMETQLKDRFRTQLCDVLYNMGNGLSVTEEAYIAIDQNVNYLHNLSYGGVFGALWDLGVKSKLGFEIDLKKISVKQEIIEACELFDINIYKLISGGSLLMTTRDGYDIVSLLEKNGIMAQVIGHLTDNNDKIIINNDEVRYLDTTSQDEIYKILGRG